MNAVCRVASDEMRPNLSLVAVVLLWGVSPIFVVGMRGAISPSRAASLAVVLAALISFAYAALLAQTDLQSALRVKPTVSNLWRPVVCGALAFYVYPKCYFNALQSPSPIEANVVNYSWPVFAVLGTQLLAKKRPSFEDALGVLLGLAGTIVIVLPAGLRSPGSALQSSAETGHSPFLAAFAGACAYGAYTALLSRTKPIGRDGEELGAVARFLLVLTVGASLHAVTNFDVLFENAVRADLGRPIVLLLAYSTLSLSLGYFCWLHAVGSLPVALVSATYYLTPALGTTLLLVYSGAPIHPSLPCGFLLVLLGIYFSRVQRTGVSPLVVALLAVLLSWSASSVPTLRITSAANTGPYSGLVALLTAIFAITGSLVLNSTRERYTESNKIFLRINSLLNEVRSGTPRNEAVEQAVLQVATHMADVCARTVIRGETPPSATGHKLISTLREELSRPIGGQEHPNSSLVNQTSKLEEYYVEWQYQKTHVLVGHEWSVLIALVSALVLASFRLGGSSVDFQIARAVFVGAVVQIAFAIRDYALGCPGRLIDLLEAGQIVFRAQDRYPYFPPIVLRDETLAARIRQRFASVWTDQAFQMTTAYSCESGEPDVLAGKARLFLHEIRPRNTAWWPTVVVLSLSLVAAAYTIVTDLR